MSLILDALRKSEAERQVGKLPGLMSPAPSLRRRRRSRWPLLLWTLLGFGLIAGGAWWLGRQGWTLSAPIANGDKLPATTTPAAAMPSTEASAATTDTPAPVPAPAPAPPTLPAAPVAAAPAPTAAAPGKPSETGVPAANKATSKQDADPPPAAPDPNVIAFTPAPAETVRELPFPAVDQMPAEQRSSLPTLKLSVHVFSDDNTRRFAVIDGRRVEEGDELSSGLRVREIRRDGVLLDVGGQPWLLARAQ